MQMWGDERHHHKCTFECLALVQLRVLLRRIRALVLIRVAWGVLRCSHIPSRATGSAGTGSRARGSGQCQLRSQGTAAERQVSHETCPEKMPDLFLFCINLSSLAILLNAQPEVGQIETFEYKQPLEQLPLLDVLVGDVALRGETPEGVSQTD